MHTHNHGGEPGGEHRDGERQPVDVSAGFEKSDVRIGGVTVFIVSMAIFVAAVAIVAWGLGKVLNVHMAKTDGKPSHWSKTVDVRELGNMPTSPDLKNKVGELTTDFPTPQVQTDDGNKDVADLHAREDLLLENYTWANADHSRVRIPIERAMELLAQRGLPVAPAVQTEAPMTGDRKPHVTAPQTNGFARTAYEQGQK
ncbi:MAG: hypothetical protein P4L03_07790 [Terracidiphilus sp.]|nr:hypothetical protein [Terracidiphilus sp.]